MGPIDLEGLGEFTDPNNNERSTANCGHNSAAVNTVC